MSGDRHQLPGRRRSELRGFEHRGRSYTLGVSYFPGTREPAEVFLSNSKPGSESEAIARDSAILASLCLQFGVDISILRHALTRDHDGSPATSIGLALDLIAIVDLDEAASS